MKTKTKLCTNLRNETAANLPLREAIKVTPKTILRSVVAQMRSAHIGCAIVVDEEDRPLGIFTERLLLKLLLAGVNLDGETAEKYFDKSFATIELDEPIHSVLQMVLHEGRRFICVLDSEGRVAGVTGQRGLSEFIAEHYPQEVMVQRLGAFSSTSAREGA